MTRFYTPQRLQAMHEYVDKEYKIDCDDCKTMISEILTRQPKKRIDAAQGYPVSQEEQEAYLELATIFVWHHATHIHE